ncbi:MAG: SDR family NAD(P)-dependent oxidoreductase [Suilimivivens sp.]
MKKRIAIITGASGGIGREFTRLMILENVDEIWAIARNQTKLVALKKEFGDKVIAISKDLSNPEEVRSIEKMLVEEKPVVTYLINNAGIAKMGAYKEFTTKEIEKIISVNCSTVATLCAVCVPYMQKGSKILNISSASSFQPLPYLNLYAATKAFVRSYSRALHAELKSKKITVTAVCPGWVDTELLVKEMNGRKVKYPGMVSAGKVARTALKDAKKGKDMSVCSLYVKNEHVFTKLMPQKISMAVWLLGIRKYGFHQE